MNERQLQEKEYLLNIYKGKLPSANPFVLRIGDNKEMFVLSGLDASQCKELDTISSYRSLYDTVLDLVDKISYSLDHAIEAAYSDEVTNHFDMFNSCGKEEWYSYYYAENALFRIESLWDILAQIYNLEYGLEEDITHVYHNRIFSDSAKYIGKYWQNGMPEEISNIVKYKNEDDDTSAENEVWKGNYAFINSLRNDMTHKFSIAENSFSSYVFTIKNHPVFIIKRIAESFSALQDFIYVACENIMDKCDFFESIEQSEELEGK